MSHIDPDLLALEALEGAVIDDRRALEHLQSCPECRAELDALTAAVSAVRAGGPGGLETPDDRVWDAIVAEVATDKAAPAPASADSQADIDRAPSAVTPETVPGRHVAPRRRSRARLAALLATATAAVVGVVIVAAVLLPRPVGIATASLDAFPAHPGASGSAELEREPDGTERVRVELDASVPADGFREVWLIADDGSDLVSLGVLDGTTGTFTVPTSVDTTRFSVVDISQEPTDGGAEHSGDSIVRGTLTRM